MKLQTHITLNPEESQIDYGSKVMLMGSCFSENIGNELEAVKFDVLQNPFGIIFNPLAIENLVQRAIENKPFLEEDLFEFNGFWRTYETHSLLHAASKTEVLHLLNERLRQLTNYLNKGTHLIFTFGTAWIYRLKESGRSVANCHKVPQHKFRKELLTPEQISECIHRVIEAIRTVNPRAAIIGTVSPVRHLKDGFVENSLSKAHLVTGIHAALKDSENAYYFPSYEIVMDELRDYRFYAEDMLHPNATAVKIIWEKFSEVWIDSDTAQIQKEVKTVQNGLNHRAFDPESTQHMEFRRKLQEKIEELQKKIPHLKF